MRFIKPVEVTPDKLKYSSVPETEHASWLAASTYTAGAKVTKGRRIWEALADSQGVDPELDSGLVWLDTGATNRWRMFDEKVSSQTKSDGTLEVRIAPGGVVNAVSLINCEADSFTIKMVDPVEGMVYEETRQLLDYGAEDFYDYFFSDYDFRTEYVLEDLPAYPRAEITVTLESSGVSAVGHLAVGVVRNLGVALYGTSVGIISFSRKETDDFGNTRVVRRPNSKRAEFDVEIETERVSFVQRELAAVDSVPVVWIGEDSIEATILFGLYQDFSIAISGPSVSDGTITVEGLI